MGIFTIIKKLGKILAFMIFKNAKIFSLNNFFLIFKIHLINCIAITA